jgi:PKD repeat protein
VTITTSTAPFTTANPVTFTANVTPTTTANILRYDWNFGDGQTATTTGNITSHKYAATSGSNGYTVTVTVTFRRRTGVLLSYQSA